MRVTPATVREEYEWVQARDEVVVPLINDTRDHLGAQFDVDVTHVSPEAYADAIDAVFANGDRAFNVAALIALLRDLDVEGDYPGFVVDELLGRELAGTIAGNQPLRLLGEATFHYADVAIEDAEGSAGVADGDPAGLDDLDAALAAGFQGRRPWWG
jgi:hypothetical protein